MNGTPLVDRNVQYPTRYHVTPVTGDIVELTPAPGEVTDEGTLINKGVVYSDETKALYPESVNNPDDAFEKLSEAVLQEKVATPVIVAGRDWENMYNRSSSRPTVSKSWVAALKFRETYYLIGADGTINTSTDLLNWTNKGDIIPSQNYTDAAVSDSRIVVVGNGLFAQARDGTSWDTGGFPVSIENPRICFNGEKFVVLGKSESTYYAFYSEDGISWNQGTIQTQSSELFINIIWCGDRFFAVQVSTNKYVYSLDGITWQEETFPVGSNYRAPVYGDGKTAVISYDGKLNTILWTEDFVTWNAQEINKTTLYDASVFFNGTFIIGRGKNFLYSTDCINWESSAAPVDMSNMLFLGSETQLYVFSKYNSISDHLLRTQSIYKTEYDIKTLQGEKIGVFPGTQIATGSYIGTGTYGPSNRTTLTFPFEPKIVFVQGSEQYPYCKLGIFVKNSEPEYYAPLLYTVRVDGNGNTSYYGLSVNFSGNSISFYCTVDSNYQLNSSGKIYSYTAIG